MGDSPPKSTFYLRVSLLTAIAMIALLPWLATVAQRSLRTMLNAPPLWAPDTLPYRQDFDWFRKHFHCEDLLLLSYEGCTLGDPRVDKLAEALENPAPEDPDAEILQLALQDVTSGPEALRNILGAGFRLMRPEGIRRLRGSFIGPDGPTGPESAPTCLLLNLTFEGSVKRREALPAILRTTCRVVGVTEEQIHVAGPPVDGAAIDEASVQSIDKLALPSALVAAVLCFVMLRSPAMTASIVLVAMFGQALVLAAVWLSGAGMNAVLTVMPALVFVLTVSAGVHLANYFRDGLREGEIEAAPTFALRAGAWPCGLATLTTVIGLLSLVVSQMSPIRAFGVISSLGVAVCLGLLFALMPGAMTLASRRVAKSPGGPQPPPWQERTLNRLCQTVAAAPRLICLAFLVGMAALAWGLTSLKTSVSMGSLFRSDSKVLADYDWMQERIGPLISVEVVLQFPEDTPLDAFGQLELTSDLHNAIDRLDGFGGSISAATFFPDIPKRRGSRSAATRGMIRGRLGAELDELERSDYLVQEQGVRSWRISSRALASSDLDYGDALRRLREALQPIFEEHAESGVSPLYTGSLPVAYEAQRALLNSLFRSFLAAFGLVAVVMMIVMRGVLPGLVAMLPNLFPTVTMFGLMGWLRAPVDIGAVMTASVALGIAVDDTLHFLLWWRGRRHAGDSAQQAVASSFLSCGRAMAQTTLICGLGLLVYTLSDFAPTQRFAWFMAGLLVSALVGDLIFLPSLLLGPAGKLFKNGKADASNDTAPTSPPAL